MSKTRRNISLAGAIDKARLSSGHTYMMLLDIEVIDHFTGSSVEMLYIANGVPLLGNPEENPTAVTWKGNDYQCAAFDVVIEEKAGDLPVVTLTANDVTGVMRERMNQYHGGVGFIATFYLVHTAAFGATSSDPALMPIPTEAEVQETFLVTEASRQGTQITFKLGDRNELAKSFPRRRQLRDFCQWQYKGVQCKYAGGLGSCDRTLQGDNGCGVHVNTENFGGFPGLQQRYV